MDKTLLIMAAGMGSRYGGNKQIDGMGPHGEMLMLYSIYDAVQAGFTKVIFVIKHDFEQQFKELVEAQLNGKIKVEYAFQELRDLPDGYSLPAERQKPLGTVHAVLSAKDLIHEPFAVLNADDYYGRDSFKIMCDHLSELKPEGEACMIGYYLKNTISENGHVTRGICNTDETGRLTSVVETYKIQPFPDGTIRDTYYRPEGDILNPDSLVSMNFFGFTPWMFDVAEKRFEAFLSSLSASELKAEFVLPVLVDQMMHLDHLHMTVLPTHATWFGVTYQEDKPHVQATLQKMHDAGAYPEKLF